VKIAAVSLFPDMFDALTEFGVSGRAIKSGTVDFAVFNPRDYTQDKHQSVDGRPYGGGPGMVMMVAPLQRAVADARRWMTGCRVKVIYLSPQGRALHQSAVQEFAHCEGIILIAGRYEGIDERFIALEVDEEWSIGDYVLSGGELAAMALADATIRLIPGSLGHNESTQQDSFSSGLLDCPHYTRPECVSGQRVPEVLLSGDHQRIRRWRLRQSLLRTQLRRPDLLAVLPFEEERQAELDDVRKELSDDD
tara:strand:- start:356 stop:1105 length:750 start_codon:yes stop_codon:yes gene_type:complete